MPLGSIDNAGNRASTWTATAQATNATATATKAGTANAYHFVTGLSYGYSIAPTAPTVAVLDSSGTLESYHATAAGMQHAPFPRPLKGAGGQSVSLTLPAGGAANVGIVNIHGYTVTTTE